MAGRISALVKKSLLPLIAFGLTAMVLSGGWLLWLGYWGVLWPGMLLLMISPLVFPLFLFPAAFFAGVSTVAKQVYPRVSQICTVLAFGWFVTLLSGYATLSFLLVRYLAVDVTLMPALVWAVAIAVTPWALFATKDKDNIFFTGLMWMMAVASIASIAAGVAYGFALSHIFWLCWALLAGMVGTEAVLEKIFIKEDAPATGA